MDTLGSALTDYGILARMLLKRIFGPSVEYVGLVSFDKIICEISFLV